jgi:putative flippase GtrA
MTPKPRPDERAAGRFMPRAPRLPQFVRFCGAGSLGFMVDGSILFVETAWLHVSPIAARGLSFSVAVIVTWAVNRSWTFRVAARPSCREFLSYLATQMVGLSSNFAIYSLLVVLRVPFAGEPVAALGLASIFALAVNYAGMRTLVFGRLGTAPPGAVRMPPQPQR